MKNVLIALLSLTFATPTISAYAALTQTEVSQLYIAVFGRASEGGGNQYWQNDPQSTNMTVTANVMLNTQPAKDYFGSTLYDNQAFIEHIYLNTLGKSYTEDPEGIDYWVSELDRGKTKGEVISALIVASQHPANAGAAQDRFNNKVEVSNYCADNIDTYTDLDTFAGFVVNVTDAYSDVRAAQRLIAVASGHTMSEAISVKDGGEISLSDGTKLSIPSEALAVDTEITVSKFTVDNDIVLSLEPEGVVFSESVTIELETPVNMSNLDFDFLIYSSAIPAVDIGNELVALEHIPYERVGGVLQFKIDHFSTVHSDGTPAIYPVFAIPPEYLRVGDIQYNMSNHLNVTSWVPGHVYLYTGALKYVESNYKYNGVVVRDSAPWNDTSATMHMGTKRRKDISLDQLEKVVEFAVGKVGSGYASLGVDNGQYTDVYSCSGLVESAFESVGKGLVMDFPVLNAVIPSRQFGSNNLETVKSITVVEGEVVKVKVYGVGRITQVGLDTHVQVKAVPQYDSNLPVSYNADSKTFSFDTANMGRDEPYSFGFKMFHTDDQTYSVTDTLTVSVMRNVSGSGECGKALNSNGTTTDYKNNLMWQSRDNNNYYTWSEAVNYCADLTLAGYDDWRLPSRDELLSIVDSSSSKPAIDEDYFPGTKASDYEFWSATTYSGNSRQAWEVNFFEGDVSHDYKTWDYYVRCVRDAP